MCIINDLTGLFYPRICLICSRRLLEKEKSICLKCISEMPKTGFHNNPVNNVARLFWGRIHIENCCSFIYFRKHSKYQRIFHELKYHRNREVGFEMGRLFGADLCCSPLIFTDLLIPVPLHPKRLKSRGYNQSEIIAQGMASILDKPVITNALTRIRNTKTQTNKTRYGRFENMTNVFKLAASELIKNKHVLLVDDVVTTGSTLEQCAIELLKQKDVKVSIATLGYADLG